MNNSTLSEKLDTFSGAYKDSFQFDIDNNLLLNEGINQILDLIPQSSKVLDLGLGHGYMAEKFASYFSDYMVLEGSSVIINDFRQKYPDFTGTIVETLFEDFIPEEKFDAIILSFILEHVEDPLDILTHYKKFLKKGGQIIISVPNFAALNKRIALEAGLITEMNVLSDADLQLGHLRLYCVESLKELIADAGLTLEKMQGIFLKPLTTAQLMSLDLSPEILSAMARMGRNYPELSVGLLARAY